jgi:hypothetical protein
MVKTDLCHGITAVEKEKLLREHISARTGNNRPLSVIGMVVFCNRLLFSQPPESDGLVSIEVHGYVQAGHAKPQSTMKKWNDSATWKQVPGGLTSDKEYMSNIRRFQDPNDEWTRLVLFGSIGANNVGRSEEKAAKRQALCDITNRAPSRPASDTSWIQTGKHLNSCLILPKFLPNSRSGGNLLIIEKVRLAPVRTSPESRTFPRSIYNVLT